MSRRALMSLKETPSGLFYQFHESVVGRPE
jgi:hypothetical protein